MIKEFKEFAMRDNAVDMAVVLKEAAGEQLLGEIRDLLKTRS